MVKLQNLLKNWSQSRHLFFADEQGGTPMAEALSAHAGPAAFLIGPEGGFDEEDRAAISATPATVPVDRKSVVEGKSVQGRVDIGGRRISKQKIRHNQK